MRVLIILIFALAEACSQPQRSPGKNINAAAHNRFRDTAFVRRKCVAADSVLAGKKDCELLDQGVWKTPKF